MIANSVLALSAIPVEACGVRGSRVASVVGAVAREPRAPQKWRSG